MLLQREGRKLADAEKKVEKYEQEIAARMYLEKVAMRILCDNSICANESTAQKILRDAAFRAGEKRPKMSPSDIGMTILEEDITNAVTLGACSRPL